MSIYSYSRAGIALANYLVESAFDAPTAQLFALVSSHDGIGVPLSVVTQRIGLPQAHVSLASLWRHGLIQYRVLAPHRHGSTNTVQSDDIDNDDANSVARHVVLACVDVAIWRARMVTHAELLAHFLQDDETAVALLRRLFQHGTLSYTQLTQSNGELDHSNDPATAAAAPRLDNDSRLDHERAIARLFALGFVYERFPLDADADTRHVIQTFLNSHAPKSRIELSDDKSSASSVKAGTKRGKSTAAAASSAGAGAQPPAPKRAFGGAAAAVTADGMRPRVDGGKPPHVHEPGVVASGALDDDTDEPNYCNVPDEQLPPVLLYNLKKCRLLRQARSYESLERIVDNAHANLISEQACRKNGKFFNFVALDAADKPRACELNLAIDPIAVALVQRLELTFVHLKNIFSRYAGTDVLIDVCYTLAVTTSVAHFAHELRVAGLVSREAPCVMRRTLVLAPLPLVQIAKEMSNSVRDVAGLLQPLVGSDYAMIENGFVRFNTKQLQVELFNETVDTQIERTYSDAARRIVGALRHRPHLTDSDIQLFTLMPQKSVRKAIGSLMSDDLIRFTEFPKQAEFAPSRSIYFWSLAHSEHLRAKLRDRIHASLERLARRLAAEHERLNLEGVQRARPAISVAPAKDDAGGEQAQEEAEAMKEDDDEEIDEEMQEEHRRLKVCGKWLSVVHRAVFKTNMQLFEKLERLEANVNFN